MTWLSQWLLLAAAIAIGWLLGRRSQRSVGSPHAGGGFASVGIPPGIRFTFESYSDEAIEKYVRALDVTLETFPMHLSIASHFRKKGEVERAILIHQNLLASPTLDSDAREKTTLELARDYMSAGLLDRAEALLKQLEKSKHWSFRSLRLLLDIYESEKEWAAARETALKLDLKRHPEIQKRLANYCCEEALHCLHAGDGHEARRSLRAALSFDKGCVRANLILAKLFQEQGGYAESINTLSKIEEQDTRFLPETVSGILIGYRQLGQESKLQLVLQRYYDLCDSSRILIALCDVMRNQEGDDKTLAYLIERLDERPSLRALDHFVSLLSVQFPVDSRQKLDAIHQVTQKLLIHKPSYLCENCGFSGRTLHWLCPSCKEWETTKPVQGKEAE